MYFVLLFGLAVGSFLNVVIHRLPQEEASLVRPASSCLSCKQAIRWYDNIPLVSYLFLRGRCRHCKQKISWEYPLVEFLTALLSVGLYWHFSVQKDLFLFYLVFIYILVAVSFIDLHLRIIPDILSLGGLAFGLATVFFVDSLSWKESYIGALFGFSIFFVFSWCYYKLTGKIGLGGGDVKLLAMIGAYLGVGGVFSTVFISSVLGSVFGILWGVFSNQKKLMGLAIPYGPFLVLGALVYLFFGEHYFSWLGLGGY